MSEFPTKRRVAVICSLAVPWLAECLDGIREYARGSGRWQLFSGPPAFYGTGETSLGIGALEGSACDGAVISSNSTRELATLRDYGIPAVNLAAGLSGSAGVPRVTVDHFKAGRLAADHLISRGLRSLAFHGWDDLWYSNQRRIGFCARATEVGLTPACFLQSSEAGDEKSWSSHLARVSAWLHSLPRPTGVFAVHDYRAQFLMEACRNAMLRVPADIAIIGMDNDRAICERMDPSLSSVARNSAKVGWNAAALLDQMMEGFPVSLEDLLVAPEGVVSRGSTELLLCEDPVVKGALDFMRDNLRAQFNIAKLAEEVGVSKRTLEIRFWQNLQSTPHEFLTNLRVQHAKVLMQVEKYTFEQVAAECGFGTIPTFYAAFRRVTGRPPGSFRPKKDFNPEGN